MKFLGSSGPVTLDNPAEMEVNEHGLKWWIDRGVKCPDCGETKHLVITHQQRSNIHRCVRDKFDARYVAQITCGVVNGWDADTEVGCGCKFTSEFIVPEAYHKKPLYERM